MTAPWEPEIALSADEALALVHAQFPELAGAPVRSLGQGWDNTAVLVGDVVFRFPRRRIAAELLDTEAHVLSRLAPSLPLPVPIPRWFGRPTRAYPWPFLGHRLLPGLPLSERTLSAAALRVAAGPLGTFLRGLHSLDGTALGLPPDPIARLDMAVRLPLLRERLEALEQAGILVAPQRWVDLFEPPLPQPTTGRGAVHGDLYASHILADDAGELCGIIDWGDVHAGDPAADLSVLWSLFPPDIRPYFLSAYGQVTFPALPLARLRATFHAVSVAAYGHAQQDEPLLRAALAALDNVLRD